MSTMSVPHAYPEMWKKCCDDTRLRFCVGIDLCHILVGKNQKTKYFPSPLLRYRNFKIWRPLKQTKTKNGRHFFISTFENLQLCFFVQNDSSTLKVLKMQFVFGWAIIRNMADWICNVPYCRLSQRQIAFLGSLEWMNHFGQKSKVVSFQKLV